MPAIKPTTLSLIGMPAVGKSTVGVLLAKQLGLQFLDTDIEIQSAQAATLQQILERSGFRALRAIEETVVSSLALDGKVVATGGSVVYSEKLMQRFRDAGPCVYLYADLATLQRRLRHNPLRGIASDPDSTFEAVFKERSRLYEQYADHTVDTSALDADQVSERVVDLLSGPQV